MAFNQGGKHCSKYPAVKKIKSLSISKYTKSISLYNKHLLCVFMILSIVSYIILNTLKTFSLKSVCVYFDAAITVFIEVIFKNSNSILSEN